VRVILIALALTLGAAAFGQDAWADCERVAHALDAGWVVEGAATARTEAAHRFAATMFFSHRRINHDRVEVLPQELVPELRGILLPFYDGSFWQVYVQDSLGTGLPALACLLRLEGF
jgi:hypothetical protein